MGAPTFTLDASTLEEADRAHIIHPYLPASYAERVVMVSGKDCTLVDANGKEYLDATGGLWLAQIGHGREELAQVAAEQISTLEYFTSFWEFSNDEDFGSYRQRAPKDFRTKWAEWFANDPYRPKPPLRRSAESERPFWRPERLRDYRK